MDSGQQVQAAVRLSLTFEREVVIRDLDIDPLQELTQLRKSEALVDEQMHERSFSANERMARDVARQRSASGTPEGAIRQVGSIPWTELQAMDKKYGLNGEPPPADVLEREDVIFSHERGKIKK